MKRKILYIAFGWTIGLLVSAFVLKSNYLLIIPVVLILFLIMKLLFKFHIKEISIVFIVFIMAVGLYCFYESFVYRPIIAYDNSEVSFSGKIVDIREYTGDKGMYTVKGKINGKENATLTVYADLYDCRINDYFKFKGIVKTLQNDYLWNSKDYYKSKGIYLTANELKIYEITANNDFSVTRILKGYTEYAKDFINKNLNEQSGSMLSAMIFGDKSNMSSDDKTLFYRTGIGHIMAVSGLHLVIFCGIFSSIFEMLRLSKFKKFIFLEIIIAAFVICSGFSMSIQRAALMSTISNLAVLFTRKADTLNSICLAFIILTAVNPFSITDPSLILSVAGTFSAGVFAPYLIKNFKEDNFIKRRFKNFVYMFAVSLFVFPFSVIFFGESSFISPIMNIVLTPLCLAALFLALIAVLIIFLNPVFLIEIAGFLCDIVLKCVRFLGKCKFAGMNFGDDIKYILIAAILVCIAIFLMFRKRKILIISIGICMAVTFTSAALDAYLSRDKLNIALLGDKSVDVIVVSKNGNAKVIDISGRKKNYSYALKYLQENNIDSLKGIVIKSNPLQAMSAYNSGFSLIDAGSILLPENTYIRDGAKVCGYTPEFSDFENLNLSFDGIEINIRNTRIFIKYGEFEFICDSKCSDENAVVYAEYENIFDPPPAKAIIVPEYEGSCGYENVVTSRNVHIIAENDGRFKIGGL